MKIPGRKPAAALAIAVVIVPAVAAGAWSLSRDEETVEHGKYDATTAYELTAEPEDDGLEVSFELRAAAPGETWDVMLEQNGSVLLEGERRTDEDAELDVDVMARSTGDDTFTVVATSPSGEEFRSSITHG